MQEKIREIISVFIKIPAAEIGLSTPVDRAAIGNSILLHRMYAKLAEGGVIIENYASVKNFSDLLKQAGDDRHQSSAADHSASPVRIVGGTDPGLNGAFLPGDGASIGIDIQEITVFPRTNDFRREEFYKMNFDPAEIAYCILQPDPYASFAGLFAAKEAIIKAAASYRNRSFHTIAIDHLAEGRPVYPGFNLSISHTGNIAVAVAVPFPASFRQGQEGTPDPASPAAKNNSPAIWLALSALVLSVLALLILLTH